MTTVNKRPQTKVELVASHLKARGHISEGSAYIEYGRFRLGDAIYRLRNERSDLIPSDMEIVTIHKKDTQGNPYGEYHLVQKANAATRQKVEQARARKKAASSVQGDNAASV